MNPAKDVPPRSKALDNPFNASHSVHSMESWDRAQTVIQLRAELKRRGFPQIGKRDQLVKRIKDHNEWILTPKGRREIYHRKLDIYQKRALAEVVAFEPFSRLPVELRLMIWELSLPAPRILSVCGTRLSTGNRYVPKDKLYFPKDDNHPNPAALSACRESRAVALKRYRLCFGTTHLYADLPGGDILHFSQRWSRHSFHDQAGRLGRAFLESTGPHGARWVHYDLANSVVTDLKEVTHVSFYPNMWYEYSLWGNTGADLRKDVKPFSNLQQLSLVTTGRDDSDNIGCWGYGYPETPSHLAFKDNLFLGEDCLHPSSQRAFRVGKSFLENELIEEDKEGRIPDVRVVTIERVTNIPGDDWERDKGEPFVRIITRCLLRFLINHYCSTFLSQRRNPSSSHVDLPDSVPSSIANIPIDDRQNNIPPHSYT